VLTMDPGYLLERALREAAGPPDVLQPGRAAPSRIGTEQDGSVA
jgi:hypothetical protein